MAIAMYICIDDNSIAINAYIHDTNHNACSYGYCCVYVYMTITITACITVIAMYIHIHGNIIDVNINE